MKNQSVPSHIITIIIMSSSLPPDQIEEEKASNTNGGVSMQKDND